MEGQAKEEAKVPLGREMLLAREVTTSWTILLGNQPRSRVSTRCVRFKAHFLRENCWLWQEVFPAEEYDEIIASLRTDLPMTFRIHLGCTSTRQQLEEVWLPKLAVIHAFSVS